MEVLKVSSKSSPNSCAGAMAGVIRQDGAVEVQVVGAGALNQAIKAVAIARGYLAAGGIDLVCVPTFADIEIDGASRTAIRLLIEDREHRMPNATLDLTRARPAIVREVRPDAPANGNGNAPAATGEAADDQRELSSFLV
jgi:stage V sporulation protein S